jgi:hypothetical protein
MATSAGSALAQTVSPAFRPLPIKVMPQTTTPNAPGLAEVSILDVNNLRAEIKELRALIKAQDAQIAALDHTIDAMKNGMATVSLKGMTNANDLVALQGSLQGSLGSLQSSLGALQTTFQSEIAGVKAAAAEQKSTFDKHRHYEFVTTFDGTTQKFEAHKSSIPTYYCSMNANEPGFAQVKCTDPQ